MFYSYKSLSGIILMYNHDYFLAFKSFFTVFSPSIFLSEGYSSYDAL